LGVGNEPEPDHPSTPKIRRKRAAPESIWRGDKAQAFCQPDTPCSGNVDSISQSVITVNTRCSIEWTLRQRIAFQDQHAFEVICEHARR
jgi:hypothetical protein